jgi:hypothetical protein
MNLVCACAVSRNALMGLLTLFDPQRFPSNLESITLRWQFQGNSLACWFHKSF